jgi:inner membrane transporter RhtA
MQPFSIVSRTAPAVGLVVTAVTTLQLGAGFAATLFDDLGPAGTAFARQAIAAAVLLALWRPRLRPHGRRELALAVAFGVTLGVMNWMIYTAIDRIPLGIAVTLEFLGPLEPAVAALAGLIVLGQGLQAREIAAIGLVVVASAGAAAQARPSSHSRIDT